ncbi:mechanosensitive ion channel [Patescibacteria group bacterium]|nr:mechanosensitive ion channel [Patescibacteria group bacterium]
MQETFDAVKGWLTLYGLQVVGAIVIMVVGMMVAKAVNRLFVRVLRKAKVEDTLVVFGGNVMKFLLMTFVIIAALNQVGFQTASLIAVLGGAMLAVGLALQGQLSSLAAGVLILISRPFKIGDMVELAGGTTGTVEAITILNTRLKGFDGTVMVLPNTNVFSNKITNYFASPTRRIELVFGIDYGDDVPKAKEILLRLMREDERVLPSPEPGVWLTELADSSVNLTARPWVNNADFWQVRCDLMEKVKEAFDEAGLSIPFPQQDVHLKGDPPVKVAA